MKKRRDLPAGERRELEFVVEADRVGELDFNVLDRRDVAEDADLLLEIRGFGRRAGIDLVI